MRVPRPGEQPFPVAEKRYDAPTDWQIREEFHRLMREELVGPKDGSDEELLTRVEARVSNRYLLGTLAPKNTHAPMEDEMQADDVESTEASEETVDEPPRPAADSMLSTSIGMTFCVDADTEVLRITFAWAVYRKQQSEHGFKTEKRGDPAMVWKRIPYDASLTFDLKDGVELAPHPDFQSVRFSARSLQVDGGTRMVSVFLERRLKAEMARTASQCLCATRSACSHSSSSSEPQLSSAPAKLNAAKSQSDGDKRRFASACG